MDKRKLLIVGSVILIIASVVVSIFLLVNNEPAEEDFTIDGIELPKNESVLEDAVVDNLKITNVSLLTRDGMSTFKAQVLNETDNSIDIDTLIVVFYQDETETEVVALKDVTISSMSDTYINIEAEIDLSNVTKIEYVLE